ncbi:MAG: leucine-rich repeat protein [Prevotella sp.]|nr:leucine-rich repeat protein [Prevotella sp.]
MKKLLTYISTLLMTMVCLGATAQTSTFKYTSSEKLPRFEEIQYFVGATGLVSHDWDASTGEGTVVYEGTVTELGSNALQWQGTMTSLTIPEGVTTLGYQSVQCCYNLSSISLPKSLKKIRTGAFYYNAFNKGKFVLDDLAWWCSIEFDDSSSNPLSSFKHIYKDKDTEITDLVIPEGVTSIGSYAFYGVEGIKSVTFPSTLTAIGGNAFARTGLESVVIPEGITEIEESTFSSCGKLKSVTIPEGVTKIGFGAFADTGLTELTLPSTIRSMSQSFHSCDSLAKLTLTDGITTVSHSFYYCNALKEVHIPGSVKLESGDFNRCENLETVTIGEGVEEITGFYRCWNLKTVTLPSTTSKVESYGFSGCSSLTSVTCLALEPPTATGQIPGGQGVGMEGRTLYVPALAQNNYKEAKNWKDFPTIETLDVMPQNIGVRDELHLTLPATLPEGKPNVTLLHDNDPKYGILHVDGEGSLKMNRFSMLIDYYMQSRNPTRALNHCSLMNNVTMEADTTVVDLWVYGKYWVFAALPFDFKVSEVVPAAEGETDWVIYTYDSRKRADSEMTETWVKMTGDEVIKAGQGFIVQAQRKLNGRTRDDVGLRFKSIDNDSKNRMFQTTDITVPLALYDSEFLHNRSWNFIGNPFPCYFDMNYTDFRAPVTVWDINSRKYIAVRPGDDDYVFCPGEGFFVQCPDDKEAIKFSKEGRQTTREIHAAAAARRGAASADRTIFNFILSDGTTTDRTRVVINEQATAKYEMDKDAGKFFADDASLPQIYTKSDGVSYAINERPLGDGIVSLCTTKAGGYCTISLGDQVEGYEVTLEDPESGKTTGLNNGNSYSFYANGETFLLHIKRAATGIRGIDNGQWTIDNSVYDLQGRKVVSLRKGIYILNGKKVIK